MKELRGRTAAITGAGAGIGRATAMALAAEGCHLALADIDPAALEDTTGAIAAEHPDSIVSRHICDVANRDAVANFAAEVADHHSTCHILVNNAGVTMAGRFETNSLDDLEWMMGINVWGVIHGCHSFLPHLTANDEGHIVNLSSMVGLLGLPRNAGYASTKGAVRMFSESLRGELRTSRVGLTIIHPGAIDTNIIQAARGTELERLQGLQSMNPRLRRWLLTSPDRVADAIVRGIRRDKARVLVGPDARVLDLVARAIPSRTGLLGRAMDRMM